MKKLLLLVSIFLLGCTTTVPVTRKFPEIPSQLATNCPELIQVPANTSISGLTKTITENYGQYYQCSDLVKNWNIWYTEQKKLYEELN